MTRFGMELVDITSIVNNSGFKLFQEVAASGGIVKAIKVEQASGLSRKDLDELKDYVAVYGAKGLAWARINAADWTSPIYKFLRPEEVEKINKAMGAKESDIIFLCCRCSPRCQRFSRQFTSAFSEEVEFI